MTPEEREQLEAGRGGGGLGRGGPGGPRGAQRPANASTSPNVPAVDRGATTIDALFAPLPVTETSGRLWVMEDGRLRAVGVRLGVTDGSATELLSVVGSDTPLSSGMALVTNVTTPDNDLSRPASAGGSPLIPQFGRRR